MKQWSTKKSARRGEAHSQWKGGRSITGKGYEKLNINLIDPKFHCMADNSGWVLTHRIVMAEHLGRPLLPEEVVHHIDENKRNNAIENLELSSRKQHMQAHKAWETMANGTKKIPKILCSDGTSFLSIKAASIYHKVNKTSVFRAISKNKKCKGIEYTKSNYLVSVNQIEISKEINDLKDQKPPINEDPHG